MKRLFYITCIIAIASVIASSIIAPVTTPPPATETSPTEVHTAQADAREYILTCDGDRIVAYAAGQSRPYIETTTSVSSLPHDIQSKLRTGIRFSSEMQMRKALEEYCS